MLEKIGQIIWAGIGFVAIATWISVVLGLTIHLIRFAWSAF